MLPKHIAGLMVILVVCALGLNLTPALAGQEDAALFQEALSAYGQWLNYGQYGLVWRPRQVTRDWRPYANGRWAPTEDGYVFETDEPWGWATYHYGNWLTTRDHGWVWVPGRTWYPHTVNWRTSDDNVGWAPVPPPETTGLESFYTEDYPVEYDSAGMNSYSAYSNNFAPLNWIFIRATNFLLGWGQPYSAAYSYYGAGLLAAPAYIPVIYRQTFFVTNYVAPVYVTGAWYNWGPPVTYITRVTNITNVDIDRRCRETRLASLRNVMPPDSVKRRHPAWREVLPTGRGHCRPAPGSRVAAGKLNRPDALPAPASLIAGDKLPGPGKTPLTASGKTIVINNSSLAKAPSGQQQLTESAHHSPVYENSKSGKTFSDYEQRKRQEILQKNSPAPPVPSTGQQLPASAALQSFPSRRDFPRVDASNPRENQLRSHPEPRFSPDQQRAEQELQRRQQQRLLTERRQQEAARFQELQRLRSQQPTEAAQQRRQAEMPRHQEMPRQRQADLMRQQQQQKQADIARQQQMQQQRQVEMQRQQQMQQQRQADMMQHQQQRQAEMMRARQLQQQQQMARQAPPPPPGPQAPPANHQKKRDNR